MIGTLGVVIAGHRRGVIESPESLFAELRGGGMWISEVVIARALSIARTLK
ncbi:MAG: DUF3368 domain-containing protein [Myxococcales bacterium]